MILSKFSGNSGCFSEFKHVDFKNIANIYFCNYFVCKKGGAGGVISVLAKIHD